MKVKLSYPVLIRRITRYFLLLVVLTAVLAVAFYYFVCYGVFGEIPSEEDLVNIQNYTASEVYSSDSVLLGKYFVENRTNVSFFDISENLLDALIATEDARFYEHKGVDRRSMFRVLIKTIILGDRSSGGGSTITQQLAKNLFPRKSFGFLTMPVNKVKEAIVARRLENVYAKEEILTMYLNTVSFGENVFGIEVAAHRFFSTTPDSISLSEAAVLIGMLKSPTAYSPRVNPERSLQRRNVVLEQMVKYGYIERPVADSVKKTPLDLKYSKVTHNEGPAPYFREYLRLELQDWLEKNPGKDGKKYNLYTDGLTIYTTINSKMQKYAEQAVIEHMSSLQGDFYVHWSGRDPWEENDEIINNAVVRSERYSTLKRQGYTHKEIEKIFREKVKMTLFNYDGELDIEMSPLDSVKYYQYFLNTGFLAITPENGFIQAWLGGTDHKYFKYDHVLSKRQVGSTFKPFVYAAAIENGIDPCEYIHNIQTVYEEYEDWEPGNANGEYGGYYSMMGGLMNSVNVVTVDVIMRTGIHNVIKLARDMGIKSELPPVPSIALGTADISLLEMVSAYSAFPNRGTSVEPVYLLKIEDRYGNIVMNFEGTKRNEGVLSEETADMMVYMLKQVVDSGTAVRLRHVYDFENEICGKTGTTQSYADGWFIGFTPELLAGAWVGAEDPGIHFRTIELGQGANMALPIWALFMKKVYNDRSLNINEDAEFEELSEELQKILDCEPYKALKPGSLLDILFGKRTRMQDTVEVDKKLLDRIINSFKKKRK